LTYLCLRVDLDYVPWDTPDAREFGHGEPAVFLRMLELARSTGFKFHFFASNRSLNALPAQVDAVLNEGHDLDWLCKRPDQANERFAKATALFKGIGHEPIGFAAKGQWLEGATFEGIEKMRFVSAQPGPKPPGPTFYPVETRSSREAIRAGSSMKTWSDAIKVQIREATSRHQGITVNVRPQVLGKLDPKLVFLREILDLADAIGATPRTLREVLEMSP
jgi:hypothetical protein